MISVRQVLSEMDQTYEDSMPKSFALEYWKEDGSLGRIAKGTKNEKVKNSNGKGSSKFKYNVKEKGVVLVYNLETKEYRSIKISRIEKFNGEEVFH